MPPHRRNIGVVFQNYALFPHMTVARESRFPAAGASHALAPRWSKRVARRSTWCAWRISGSARPAQLSGGQQQRIALARALVFEPKLVLMDEPLGALDKQLREHMQLEIKHLHARLGINVVYVTHDQGEALTMSDRIGVFNDGIFQQVAPPDELYEAPANTFVAQFIGENNAISGQVRELSSAGRCVLATEDGSIIQAKVSDGLAVGMPATLALRPERLLLSPADGSCCNRFNARVEELIYYGDHTRLRVAACGRSDILVKVPSHDVLSVLQPGATIDIGWRAEDCRALPLN